MKDWPEDFSLVGMVERAVLHYLQEDSEGRAGPIRYEIIRVDRFEYPYADSEGTFFTALVRTLPQQKEEVMKLGVLLATFHEDGSLKISAPIISTHLGCL